MSFKKEKPPGIGEWILKRIFPGYTNSTAPGDFEEVYTYMHNHNGVARAWFWYWAQIFKSIPPFFINWYYGSSAMFNNYFIISLRNLKRNKIYSFINISGLAIGMACCIVIMLFVQDELSYDRFHENADRIYRLANELTHDTGVMRSTMTFPYMAPNLKEFPEIEGAVRIKRRSGTIMSYGSQRFDERAFYSDPDIFEIFTFQLIKGDEKTALKDPFCVVLTEKLAEKFFGKEEPMGKTVTVENKYDFKVTGILKEIPNNSHLRFDFLASYNSLRDILGTEYFEKYNLLQTYLLLNNNASKEEIEKKIDDFIARYKGEKYAARSNYFIQPLTSIHLHSDLSAELGENSNLVYSYGLSAVALLILLIACINFMNLSTARASRRSKEVGLRKVIGAQRVQILRQFLGESVFLSFIALFIAVTLTSLLLPMFNSLMNRQLIMGFKSNLFFYLGLVFITLFVGFLSGSYPAFFLSGFKPAQVLKGQIKKSSAGGVLIRKGLVVFQFTISVLFIVGTIIIMHQLNFIKNEDLGFQKDYIVKISASIDKTLGERYNVIKKELMDYPDIIDVTYSFDPIGIDRVSDGSISQSQVHPEGFPPDEAVILPVVSVSDDFFKFFGMDILYGRNFSANFSTDREEAVILNEKAAKTIGWDDPVGRELAADFYFGERQCKVVGVVKDFHLSSLREEIQPAVFVYRPDEIWIYWVKISSENVQETLSFLQRKWNGYTDKMIFSYSFLDEEIEAHYKKESEMSRVFKFSSLLAIIIACLGLFGLVLFTTSQRTKEIGIRKILGAGMPGIVTLISKDFLKLVVLSNVIAWPVIYFAMNRWLENFTYRVSIGLWMFLTGALIVIIIALVTISFQSFKAALANPVDTLRYE